MLQAFKEEGGISFGSAARRLSKMGTDHWIQHGEFTLWVRFKAFLSLAFAQCVFRQATLLSKARSDESWKWSLQIVAWCQVMCLFPLSLQLLK